MSENTGEIVISAADLKEEIKAVEQSVEEAASRVAESVAHANAAVSSLEGRMAAQSGTQGEKSADINRRLSQARRNVARVQQEGEAELKRFRQKANDALDKLRCRLKLVEEKLASRR